MPKFWHGSGQGNTRRGQARPQVVITHWVAAQACRPECYPGVRRTEPCPRACREGPGVSERRPGRRDKRIRGGWRRGLLGLLALLPAVRQQLIELPGLQRATAGRVGWNVVVPPGSPRLCLLLRGG